MATRQSKAWTAIHAQAWWKLHHSDELPPAIPHPAGHPWLELWKHKPKAMLIGRPSDPISFSVFRPPSREWVVRRAVWSCSADLRSLSEKPEASVSAAVLNPTVTVTDAAVEQAGLLALLREAEALSIPVAYRAERAIATMGSDAEGFAIASSDRPPSVVRLQWSEKSAPWPGVYEWHDRMC